MKRKSAHKKSYPNIVYLPILISNPVNSKSVFVNARVANHGYFGFLADLSREVIDALNLSRGRIIEGVDDNNELIKFRVNKVTISFNNQEVTGEVITNSLREDTVLFLSFITSLPASVDLSRYGSDITMRRVFLSHSHKDKRFVNSLAKHLSRRGIGVWVDEAEIKIGESLIQKLRDAIDNVDFVIAVISPTSVRSQWVQKEIDIAMNQEIKKKKVKVLPVLIGDCVLPGFLEGKLFADFRKLHSKDKAVEKLIDSILKL